jgi:hypothetical protein
MVKECVHYAENTAVNAVIYCSITPIIGTLFIRMALPFR